MASPAIPAAGRSLGPGFAAVYVGLRAHEVGDGERWARVTVAFCAWGVAAALLVAGGVDAPAVGNFAGFGYLAAPFGILLCAWFGLRPRLARE